MTIFFNMHSKKQQAFIQRQAHLLTALQNSNKKNPNLIRTIVHKLDSVRNNMTLNDLEQLSKLIRSDNDESQNIITLLDQMAIAKKITPTQSGHCCL